MTNFSNLENFGTISVGDKSIIYNGDFSGPETGSPRHWGKTQGSKWLEGWIGVADLECNVMDKKVFYSAPQSLKLYSKNAKKGACVTYFYVYGLKPPPATASAVCLRPKIFRAPAVSA